MKTYNMLGRDVYIKPTMRTVYKQGYYGNTYRSKPYTVHYVADGSLALDGQFCSVAVAKESIAFRNKYYRKDV